MIDLIYSQPGYYVYALTFRDTAQAARARAALKAAGYKVTKGRALPGQHAIIAAGENVISDELYNKIN